MADPTTYTPEQVAAALDALGIVAGDDLESVNLTLEHVQINRSLHDETGTTRSSAYPVTA